MSQTKQQHAISIIKKCIGTKGVWASSDRYKNQCWTRDFCIATSYSLMHEPELQNLKLVLLHLVNIVQHQKTNGKIPILFLDKEKEFLKDKIERSIEIGKVSFMLERYLEDGLEDLTPHTRDSEVLFVIIVCELIEFIITSQQLLLEDNSTVQSLLEDPSVVWVLRHLLVAAFNALKYIEENILKNELIFGADWRDVRIDLNDKTVLTNACFLYRAHDLLAKVCSNKKLPVLFPVGTTNQMDLILGNQQNNAQKIKENIHNNFWNGQYFVDYPGSNAFDLLGNSLVIIYGIAEDEQSESILNYALTLSTPFGIKTTETFLPPLSEKEKTVMERDKAVIWPFTNGFMLDAMITRGGKWIDIAKQEFSKWCNMPGFYEWYDIVDGQGYGSVDQVWSAALFLRIRNKLSLLDP